MRDRTTIATSDPITRREAVRRTTIGAVSIATGACLGATTGAGAGDGRLRARVTTPATTIAPGLHALGLGGSRDGFLYVPMSHAADTSAPLALLLHGAGQEASELVTPMRPLADTSGLVLVAPDSRGATWDAIRGAFGGDVAFIDRALAHAFSRARVDAARVRVAGFSDGASYALSLGMINGTLFSRIAAFSPGFLIPGPPNGKPRIFITHGTRDPVLPIETTSRRMVPALEADGYDVQYTEFDGGHTITRELLSQATSWLAASG